MPRYDQSCTSCGWVDEITAQPFVNPPCPRCGAQTGRIYLGGYRVVGDEFPGGKTFENLGHRPVTVYSKSELKREMEKRGLAPKVQHIGTPGSDRSPHTSRWV